MDWGKSGWVEFIAALQQPFWLATVVQPADLETTPMINLPKALTGVLMGQGKWQKIMKAALPPTPPPPDIPTDLVETRTFGANPGGLRMFSYLPPTVTADCPLLVVLHGCTQTAAGYDYGAGWSTLADRFGFALLFPEQQSSNNPKRCFNWFLPGDTERGHGEAESIRQMVAKMIADHRIDPARVFITGLSAGGAMTSVMLATYPDVFAGGAIIAGLPYGAATNVQQAFETMYQCPPRPPRVWGNMVRRASSHKGPWPRVSVWHGAADATVIPSNAVEIVKQWTDVHGLSVEPSCETVVDGYPRQVWTDNAGNEVIESYTIPRMAHGTPLASGAADHQCGVAGPFLLDVGISSSYHIAKFFGLAEVQAQSSFVRGAVRASEMQHEETSPTKVFDGEILVPNGRTRPQPPSFDVGAVITKALKAAGLLKHG